MNSLIQFICHNTVFLYSFVDLECLVASDAVLLLLSLKHDECDTRHTIWICLGLFTTNTKLLKILTHSGLASCRYYALTHQHECGALTVHLLM